MYKKSFPKCEVKGEFDPVEYGHMISHGSIPKKCSTCSNLFEGECTRGLDEIGKLLRLDYDSCYKTGTTEPTKIEINSDNPVFVPNKCIDCEYLSKSEFREYFCSYEKEKWKDFPRDLDWGDWKPDYPLIGLRRFRKGKYSNEDLGPLLSTKN